MFGKPGNIKDFDSCQGNVSDFTISPENIKVKSCQGKVARNCLSLVSYLCPYGYLVASS